MNIKFRKLPITDIEGNTQTIDFAQLIGNVLFNQADDVAEHDLGIKIYHEPMPDENTGECPGTDIDDKEVNILRKYLPYFKYNLRNAIEQQLKQ
jgi:hypothetical protein